LPCFHYSAYIFDDNFITKTFLYVSYFDHNTDLLKSLRSLPVGRQLLIAQRSK
jgi:hypothetical protein